MSTHKTTCCICYADCYCCNDTHILGLTKEGCEESPYPIEFCSLACFMELKRRWDERFKIAKEREPQLFA